MHLICI